MTSFYLRALDSPEDMQAVEHLQRRVWPGSETDIVPVHMLLAAAHNGGLLVGAYLPANQQDAQAGHPFSRPQDVTEVQAEPALVGFVFGFPGMYATPDGPRLKHCSHMLGVDPAVRDQGIGFALKRAQWQMVRQLGVDRITWTYDPLLSRNAHLNIARLGAVCSTYIRQEYGNMRDGLNSGLPSDRFQVDWWVNSTRVNRKLSQRIRPQLDLAHFLAAGTPIVNPTQMDASGWPRPSPAETALNLEQIAGQPQGNLLLVEIPPDFQALRAVEPQLALDWRMHTRQWFELLFHSGYLVTDLIYLPGTHARSFYVLSYGLSTL